VAAILLSIGCSLSIREVIPSHMCVDLAGFLWRQGAQPFVSRSPTLIPRIAKSRSDRLPLTPKLTLGTLGEHTSSRQRLRLISTASRDDSSAKSKKVSSAAWNAAEIASEFRDNVSKQQKEHLMMPVPRFELGSAGIAHLMI
jgi:hypothetical protein